MNKSADALDQFYQVQRAYETLIDPQKRLDYDHRVAVERGLVTDNSATLHESQFNTATVSTVCGGPAAAAAASPRFTSARTRRQPAAQPAAAGPAVGANPAAAPRQVRTYGYGRPVVYMPSYRRTSKQRHERQMRRLERRNRLVQYGLVAACVLAGLVTLYQLAMITSFTQSANASTVNPPAAHQPDTGKWNNTDTKFREL